MRTLRRSFCLSTFWLGSPWLGWLCGARVAHAEERVRTYEVSASELGETSPSPTRMRTHEVKAPTPEEAAPVTYCSNPSAEPSTPSDASCSVPNSSSADETRALTVVEPTPPGAIPPAPGTAPGEPNTPRTPNTPSTPSAEPTSPPAAPTEAVEVVGTAGRWVYTLDYGWIWVPNAAPLAAVGPINYVYIYTPNYGWAWYVTPWGPGPYYFGIWAWRAAVGRAFWGARAPAPNRFVQVQHHAGARNPKGSTPRSAHDPSTQRASSTQGAAPRTRPPSTGPETRSPAKAAAPRSPSAHSTPKPAGSRPPPAHPTPQAPVLPSFPAGRWGAR